MSYCTACPGKELLSCELLAMPAAAADCMLQNVHKISHHRNHAMKAARANSPCTLYVHFTVLPENRYSVSMIAIWSSRYGTSFHHRTNPLHSDKLGKTLIRARTLTFSFTEMRSLQLVMWCSTVHCCSVHNSAMSC
jgi:hypothetical protein